MIFLITIVFLTNLVQAQYDYEDPLRLDITPYVWMTTMNGNITINGQNRLVNFTFEDFFKFSNLGLNGHVELKKRKWGFIFDYNYVDLLKDNTYTELVLTELSFAYRIFEKFEIIAGGRYFKAQAEYRDDQQNIEKGSKSWTDPIIGARVSWDLTPKLVFTARGDVGGFGIGSEFEWNIMSGIGYNLANITFMAAYRIWYTKYSEGQDENQFTWDMTTSGPGLAMIIHF